MATIAQVEDAVAALLSALGRTVVQGRIGEAGAPSSPYAMWSLESLELSDFPVITIDGLTQTIISTNTPLEFLINLVGGPAMVDATKFGLSLRQTQRTADLYKLCGLSGLTPFLNLAALETGTYRQRIEFRLTLFAAVDLVVTPEWIETQCVEIREASKEFDETICYTQGECH